VELELLAARFAVRRFATLGAAARLFVNFSPAVLAGRAEDPGSLLALLGDCGMQPEKIVIELTENGALLESSVAWDELLRCRALGFGIAIDDLGEGFASLRLWAELRPEYVKIDKHFIHGIHADPIKLEIARAVQQIARASGTHVVAEGIEDEADFQTVRDLGIPHGQGYLIARPAAALQDEAARRAWNRLSGGPLAAFPMPGRSVNRVTARRLLKPVEPVSPATDNDAVYARFEQDSSIQLLPVVEEGVPVGTISRLSVIDGFARPYRRELYGRRPCAMLMNAGPVTVDADTSIQELSLLISDGDPRVLREGFLVTERGRYAGVGSTQDLMRIMTELQLEAARYANPLTLLPGNVPIAEHVERLLSRGCRFVLFYCDLDNFKPFNDVFGYQRGDEAIQLTARVLAEVCDPRIDFLGHIGGDDFVVVLQSDDWEARAQRALLRFEKAVGALFSEGDRERKAFAAEDRQRNARLFPLLTCSMGVVAVSPGTFDSHAEVAAAAAEAKRFAKRRPGNSLFVERRRHPATSILPPSPRPDGG